MVGSNFGNLVVCLFSFRKLSYLEASQDQAIEDLEELTCDHLMPGLEEEKISLQKFFDFLYISKVQQ